MPNIANINITILENAITLSKAGKELNNAFIASFNPSFLLITLRGLNALSALNAFNDFNDYFAAAVGILS